MWCCFCCFVGITLVGELLLPQPCLGLFIILASKKTVSTKSGLAAFCVISSPSIFKGEVCVWCLSWKVWTEGCYLCVGLGERWGAGQCFTNLPPPPSCLAPSATPPNTFILPALRQSSLWQHSSSFAGCAAKGEAGPQAEQLSQNLPGPIVPPLAPLHWSHCRALALMASRPRLGLLVIVWASFSHCTAVWPVVWSSLKCHIVVSVVPNHCLHYSLNVLIRI